MWIKRCCKRLWHAINPLTSFGSFFLLLVFLIILLPRLFCILSGEIYWTAAIGLIAYCVARHIEARKKRYSTLCNLEVELNHAMCALSDNIQNLEKSLNVGAPLFMKYEKMEVDHDTVKELSRLEVKNLCALLMSDFRRINSDLGYMSSHISSSAQQLMNDPTEKQAILEILKELLDYCKRTMDDLKKCLVMTRYFIKQDKAIYFDFHLPYYDKSDLEKWIVEDSERLEREIEELNS